LRGIFRGKRWGIRGKRWGIRGKRWEVREMLCLFI